MLRLEYYDLQEPTSRKKNSDAEIKHVVRTTLLSTFKMPSHSSLSCVAALERAATQCTQSSQRAVVLECNIRLKEHTERGHDLGDLL